MSISVSAAAKRLCERSGWSLTNLKLQKLLYISHMFHLGKTGEPLVNGHFEAWDYGPVSPFLYHKVKVFGSSPVENIFHSTPDIGDVPENVIDPTAKIIVSCQVSMKNEVEEAIKKLIYKNKWEDVEIK